MEEWQTWWAETWPEWYAWLASVDPLYYAIGGGVLLLLLIVRSVTRRRKQVTDSIHQPKLAIQSFQIAPLGRDAFLRIRNEGPPARLSAVNIYGRNDVVIKNNAAGQLIDTGKEYSLLLETTSTNRLTKNIDIDMIFAGPDGRVYQQRFNPNLPVPAPAQRY